MNKQQKSKERNESHAPPGRIALTKEAMTNCCKRVMHYLKTEKRYLQPTYSLWELAHELGLSARLISMSINTYIGQDFFELIDRMRVEEAKTLLRNSNKTAKKISLEEIGSQSGFNSRSSFFYCFKKYAGISPGKYMLLNDE